jgi:putative acetyltransferase
MSVELNRAGDLDAVIAVFRSAVREVASRDYDPAQVAAWSTVDRDGWSKKRGGTAAWVAEIDELVVGFSDLEPDGLINMMFVDAQHGFALIEAQTVEKRGQRFRNFRMEKWLG